MGNKTQLENYKKIRQLIYFTLYPKATRNIIEKFISSIKKSNDKDFDYIYTYHNISFPFSIFSENELQEYDKKTLKSVKRYKNDANRVLKLACSLDLVEPNVVIGNSSIIKPGLLIKFKNHGKETVIDYANNLIMNKEDYYELFSFEELNILDKFDLYRIDRIARVKQEDIPIQEYLLNPNKLFQELSKEDGFEFLTEEYNKTGLNMRNETVISDDLFFQDLDQYHMKYDKLVRELNRFTENPTIKTKHITYGSEQQEYKLQDRKFGSFTFHLLSDCTNNEERRKKLLSKNRYHNCHNNSVEIARSLAGEDKENVYVVGGKFKENETDYFFHSWVEIDDINVVIDYNHNLVMNRDEYYRFFEAEPIGKTSVSEIEELAKMFVDMDFYLSTGLVNYFGPEIKRDLMKNEKVFIKK